MYILKVTCLSFVLLSTQQAMAQSSAAEIPRVSRDVTPRGVTPGPEITAPLKRIPGVEPPPPEVKSRNLYRIRVIDTATFEGRLLNRLWRVELPGIAGIARSETCTLDDGATWPCGQIIIRQLQKYIRLSAFKCDFAWQSQAEPLEISCKLRDEDISHTVLSRGWARASNRATDEQKDLAENARKDLSGIYQIPSENWLGLSISTREGTSADLPPPPDLPTVDILGPLDVPAEEPQP